MSALVGSRIYPLRLPERPTLPAIRYQRISTDPADSHSGSSGLEHVRVQLGVHAATYASAEAVAAAIKTALDAVGSAGPGQASFVVNDTDLDVEQTEGVLRIVDVMVWHQA